MNIATRLIELRDQLSWSNSDIARRLKVSSQAVSQWMHDETEPKPKYLRQLADLTGYRFEWLAMGREPKMEVLPDDAVAAIYHDFTYAMKAETTRFIKGLAERKDNPKQ